MKPYFWGPMVSEVFIYWRLIMSYQELIVFTLGSLSAAGRSATGHWLYTLLQSCIPFHPLVLLLCSSFSCHVPHLCSFDSRIMGGHSSLNYERTLGPDSLVHGFDFLPGKLFWQRFTMQLFIHHCFQYISFSSIFISCCHLIDLYISASGCFLCFFICTFPLFKHPSTFEFLFSFIFPFLILCSHLQISDPEQLAHLYPSFSIHSSLHIALAHCPAFRPALRSTPLLYISTFPPVIYGNMLMGQTQVKIEYILVTQRQKAESEMEKGCAPKGGGQCTSS